MFCRMCGKEVESNLNLQSHLRSDHWMSLSDYYRYFPDATKVCNKCKKELPVTRFYFDRCKASGYRTQCIHCISPDGEKRECPLCHRLFKWSAVANHLQKEHQIRRIDIYRKHLKEKYCHRCKTVKPLRKFYKLKNGRFFPYCRECVSDRNRKYHRAKMLKAYPSVIQHEVYHELNTMNSERSP